MALDAVALTDLPGNPIRQPSQSSPERKRGPAVKAGRISFAVEAQLPSASLIDARRRPRMPARCSGYLTGNKATPFCATAEAWAFPCPGVWSMNSGHHRSDALIARGAKVRLRFGGAVQRRDSQSPERQMIGLIEDDPIMGSSSSASPEGHVAGGGTESRRLPTGGRWHQYRL